MNKSRLQRARRRLREEVRPYWSDLAENWSETSRRWEDVTAFYRGHEWFRSLCHGVVALLVITALDAVSGHPVGFRFLFIVPVFVASLRGDLVTSSLVTAATFMVLMTFDWRYGILYEDTATLSVVVNFAALSSTACFIVAMQRHIRRIHHTANHDPLTGAMNRAAIQSLAESAIRTARAENGRLIVGVIDCDGFKEINDQFGHAVGDEVLMGLAKILQGLVGKGGWIGRTGGDEFVIVLRDRSQEFAVRLLERARQDYIEATVGIASRRGFSFGLAELETDGMSYGELVQAADTRMYQDKAATTAIRFALTVH
jgi:diguanylate cyclase (GGDEF)-like protein